MGFRRSEVRILSPRNCKACRDNEFRQAFYHFLICPDVKGRVEGRVPKRKSPPPASTGEGPSEPFGPAYRLTGGFIMKFPKPFFRKAKHAWYVQLGKRQVSLGPDREKAFE